MFVPHWVKHKCGFIWMYFHLTELVTEVVIESLTIVLPPRNVPPQAAVLNQGSSEFPWRVTCHLLTVNYESAKLSDSQRRIQSVYSSLCEKKPFRGLFLWSFSLQTPGWALQGVGVKLCSLTFEDWCCSVCCSLQQPVWQVEEVCPFLLLLLPSLCGVGRFF